jgi:uncharacterized cysteine cluster protein YcgN (CxxCxxCC family)
MSMSITFHQGVRMGTRKIKRKRASTRKSFPQKVTDETWECKGCGKCCEYLPFKASPGRDRDHDAFWGIWGMETFNYGVSAPHGR